MLIVNKEFREVPIGKVNRYRYLKGQELLSDDPRESIILFASEEDEARSVHLVDRQGGYDLRLDYETYDKMIEDRVLIKKY